jgi:hypothetical protein
MPLLFNLRSFIAVEIWSGRQSSMRPLLVGAIPPREIVPCSADHCRF